jgi:hypothetical protein
LREALHRGVRQFFPIWNHTSPAPQRSTL